MSVISMREFDSVEFFKVTPPSTIKTLHRQIWSSSTTASESINKFNHTSRNTFHSPSSSSSNPGSTTPTTPTNIAVETETEPVEKDLLEYTFSPEQLSVNPQNHILTGSLEVRQVIKELHDTTIDDDELIPESIYQLQVVLKTLSGQPWAIGVYDTLQYEGQPIVKPTTTAITKAGGTATGAATGTSAETANVIDYSFSHFTTIEQISENKYIVFINYGLTTKDMKIAIGVELKPGDEHFLEDELSLFETTFTDMENKAFGLFSEEEEYDDDDLDLNGLGIDDDDDHVLIENVDLDLNSNANVAGLANNRSKRNQLDVKTVVYDDESDGEIVTVVKEHVDSELSERFKNITIKYEDENEDEEEDDFGDFIAA
ncbi:unnamed protein product [Ambrosiozyma monospora]|uniref:Unnamed protein product n=1 Tax=Ambrosiozyma monospora TaxID=43982 RepID=A0A9W6YXB0_AMBMO|nr:unnamed protein product [Ambrosiozyma monospora]